MTFAFRLKLTPRVTRMLDAEQMRAEQRGDGYFGAEHLLEAILDEPDSVPAQLIARLGVTNELRRELADYFTDVAERRDERKT